jgi:hypothetical protein
MQYNMNQKICYAKRAKFEVPRLFLYVSNSLVIRVATVWTTGANSGVGDVLLRLTTPKLQVRPKQPLVHKLRMRGALPPASPYFSMTFSLRAEEIFICSSRIM